MLEHLKTMPIDILSTLESNLPINWLVSSGYETIYDIHHLSKNQLMNIDGIGIVYAEAIYRSVHRIKRSVLNDVVPKIDPDQMSYHELELLRTIYYKRNLLEKIQTFRERLIQFIEQNENNISLAKQKRGFIGRLFQSKQKREAIDEALEHLYSDFTKKQITTIENSYEDIKQFSIDDNSLIEHYINENISYYVEIESVIGVDPSKTTDALPSEIVEEINAYSLNTEGLTLQFRAYQLFGSKYALHFKRTLLGDEMGLGKTIQALGLINHLYQEEKKHSIVVCPLSLLSNWKREIERFSQIPVTIFHGATREQQYKKWQKKSGVLLTTYEHTMHLQMEYQSLDALIVDEAHYVKNPNAIRSENVYALCDKAEYVLFMSGTPLENNIEEMKQLITVLNKEVGDELSGHLFLLEPRKFKQTIQEVYLRRNRNDVLEELPQLEMVKEWVPFGEEEYRVYQTAVVEGKLMLMRRAAWLGGRPEKSPKLARLLDICDRARQNGHKVIVFSFFKDVLRTIHNQLGDRTFDVITGDVSNQRRQEIIDEFSQSNVGSVLISQISAGGVGLNIQAANIVVLCEPQWKPSIENQAISRAYRMGQSRKVVVYRLLTERSIDESMLEILGHKEDLFDLYARESEISDVTASIQDDQVDENVTKQVLEMEKARLEKVL